MPTPKYYSEFAVRVSTETYEKSTIYWLSSILYRREFKPYFHTLSEVKEGASEKEITVALDGQLVKMVNEALSLMIRRWSKFIAYTSSIIQLVSRQNTIFIRRSGHPPKSSTISSKLYTLPPPLSPTCVGRVLVKHINS